MSEVMAQIIDDLSNPNVKAKAPKKPKNPVRKFTMGVAEKMTANILFAVLTILAGGVAVYFAQPADTTPKIYVDAVTGCQYLTTGAGITPRLDRLGFQLCGE